MGANEGDRGGGKLHRGGGAIGELICDPGAGVMAKNCLLHGKFV